MTGREERTMIGFVRRHLRGVNPYMYLLIILALISGTASKSWSAPVAPTNVRATAVSSRQINITWTDSGTSQAKYYRVRAYDGTNYSADSNVASQTISDTTAPTGTISINAGATYATGLSVTLNLTAIDTNSVAQMQFSNDNTTWSTVETYSTTKAWTLDAGESAKTVYVKFKDNAGNWSTTTGISDTIILDP